MERLKVILVVTIMGIVVTGTHASPTTVNTAKAAPVKLLSIKAPPSSFAPTSSTELPQSTNTFRTSTESFTVGSTSDTPISSTFGSSSDDFPTSSSIRLDTQSDSENRTDVPPVSSKRPEEEPVTTNSGQTLWRKVTNRQKSSPTEEVAQEDKETAEYVNSAADILWAAQSKVSAPEAFLWEQAFIRATEQLRRKGLLRGEEPAAAAAPAAVAPQSGAKAIWGGNCPAECRCRPAQAGEVPLYRVFFDAAANGTVMTSEELELQPQLLVRVADCVALGGKISELLNNLPNDTQFLSLLQGESEDPAQLRRAEMQHLRSLIGLQVRAFRPGSLLLRSDALRDSSQLRLLSMHGVHLLGTAEDEYAADAPHATQSEEPPLDILAKTFSAMGLGDEPPDFPAYSDPSQDEGLKYDLGEHEGSANELVLQTHIVFLPPPKPSVLPFPRYRALSQRAALHAFRPLTQLQLLRLEECGLRAASWEMFAGLAALRVLALPNNGLRQISDFAFAGAPHLRVLSLAGNKLDGVTSTALAGLLELVVLDMSNNEISLLSELSLPPFPKLRFADFSKNPVDAVLAYTFQIMNSSHSLILGGSGIPLRIQADAFYGMTFLRSLTINDIMIPALDRSLLRGMARLRQLQLQGHISAIPLDAFAEVPKLERLALRNCSLRALSMDAFYTLYGLQVLDLSHNLISFIPPGLLDQQTRLRELDLSNNLLKGLPDDFVSSLPSKLVRLDHNPWHCTCSMRTWRPAATNKVYRNNRYEYEGRVAPRCAEPKEVEGWDVYHALRKFLRCDRQRFVVEEPRIAALLAGPRTSTTSAPTSTSTAASTAALNVVTPGRLPNDSYVIVDMEGNHRVVSKKVYKLALEQSRGRQRRG